MLKRAAVIAVGIYCAILCGATHPDAGAREVLKKYAEAGKKYTPRTGRTAIFARAQIKYGLEKDDYLRRWTDRPLWQDTALQKQNDGGYINPGAWKLIHRSIGRYGIDGWAFFPISSGRDALFETAATPGWEMTILPEFVLNVKPEKTFPQVDKMLESKQVYRFNGKFVITTYAGTDDPSYWMKLKKVLTAKYGDKFLFLPMHDLPRHLTGYGTGDRVLTAEGVNELADIIRKWLRCVDGYYYNNPALNEFARYDSVFDHEVMIPLLHGILSEPEFKDKLLAWGTKSGHENFYEKGSFTYNCGGTSMLRGSVGAAVAAKADIINLVEWDEENENTHFCPTIANGFATKRIIRYFAQKAQHKILPPLDGDDLSVPDVILSYRRVLTAGERLTCEVVNVPGAESKPGKVDVTLKLKEKDGKTVRTFSGTLDRMKLAELRFDLPVAEVLDSHLLIPELTVDGRKFTGFTPVELRANYNGDNKWYKHPVRDLAKCRADLKVTPLSDGKVRIDGKLVSASPLHQVALLDCGAEIWMDNTPPEFQESADRVVFQVLFRFKPKAGLQLQGDVRVINGGDLRKFSSGCNDVSCMKPVADGWQLHGRCSRNGNLKHMIFSIDRASAEKAAVAVDLTITAPGKAPEKVFDRVVMPVKELMSKGIYALSSKYMCNLVFHHSDHTVDIPAGSGKKEVSFSVVTAPGLPQSVFYIEAFDVNRKSFRSQPVTIYRPSGEKTEFSACDFFGKKAVAVKCDKALLTPQKFIISPEYGAAVKNSGGNMLRGIAGGQVPLVNNLRFMGESGYGSSVFKYHSRQKQHDLDPAPATVKNGSGQWVWRFDGKQSISFPICTIYPYSGFELKVRFTPRHIRGTQTLVSNGHAGFRLLLKKGVPYVEFYRRGAPQVKFYGSAPVNAGCQSEVILRFDQKNMQLITNGVPGKMVPCSGYQLYPKAVSVGLDPSGWGFCGDVAACEIRPI